MDHDIMKTLDFGKHRPKVVCIETAELGTGRVSKAIVDLMASKGYTARGGSIANTIFLDDRVLGEVAKHGEDEH
jgi:hypothetical protein